MSVYHIVFRLLIVDFVEYQSIKSRRRGLKLTYYMAWRHDRAVTAYKGTETDVLYAGVEMQHVLTLILMIIVI